MNGSWLLMAAAGAAVAAESEPAALQVAYPVPCAVVQRDTPSEGVLHVRGRYPPALDPGRIEARFCGRVWQVLDRSPTAGAFAGTLREAVGQGELEVRTTAAPTLVASVPCVGIGDLFVIAGQSNADGRGTEHHRLNPANPYVGAKYRHQAWSAGDDPSANDTDDGSPWPWVLDDLIAEQKVPIGYIQAAVGSTVVRQWHRGGDMYARMLDLVKAATDGSLAVRAVLYYQGENDITHYNTLSVLGDYAAYRENLLAVAADVGQDLHVPLLVGQITNLLSDRNRNDSVRRAQQEAWTESPNARPGAVVYDILPTDGVHYRDAANLRAFARRWTAAIRASIYGAADSPNPRLRTAQAVDATTVRLTFDQDLAVTSWDGKPGAKALGFRFSDGATSLTDADVVSTAVAGPQVTVRLGTPIGAAARLSYGSGADGQGQATLRAAASGLPVLMVFSAPLSAATVGPN